MKKLTVAALISICIINSTLPVFSGSLLTKSENFSKAATYGLNLATYTAEKQDGKQAVEKLMMFDVLWDVMGKNEELFLNGDPEAFSKFKDDILKVKLVLDKVAEVSTQLGAGEYNEALIASVDGMVGIVNHPVVNLLWESVKLTYESHKLVKNTKAELEIETLYGRVNNDRRLIGTMSGNSAPLIPINSDTVTYFYNKYLITDPSTRALVKTYVKKKLGEEFPELTNSESIWAYLTDTTQAVQDEHELKQLQEFENTSRRWIKALLEDLNKQVQEQWAQTRLRQEQAKFKMFSAQFGKAISNMDEVFAHYAKIKEIEKEKVKYPEILTELTNKKNIILATLSKAKTEEKLKYRGLLYTLSTTCSSYALNSLIINEPSFQKSFEDLQIEYLKLINTIDKNIEANKGEIIEESMEPDNSESDYYNYEKSMLNIFKPALNALNEEMSIYEDPPVEQVQTSLSTNNIDDAEKLIYKWKTKQEEKLNNADKNFKDNFQKCESLKPDINTTPIMQKLIKSNKKIKKSDIELATAERDKFWQNAIIKTQETKETIISINTQQYNKDLNKLFKMVQYFTDEMYRVKNAVDQNLKDFTAFKVKLFHPNNPGIYLVPEFRPSPSIQNWQPDVAFTAHGANQYLEENRYTSIGKINDTGVSINNIGSLISIKKNEIMAPLRWHSEYITTLSNIDGELARLDGLKTAWANFYKLDNETITLYNDFTKYDSLEKQYEAERDADWKLRSGEAHAKPTANPSWGKIDQYNETMTQMTRLMNSINTALINTEAKNYLSKVYTDLNNRQNDYDYLEQLEKQWEKWYQEQISNNILTIDRQSGKYIIGLGAGVRKAEGGNYAIISKPYNHYALKEELENNDTVNKAKEKLLKLKVYKFIQFNMPNAKILLDKLFTAQMFEAAPEDNFLLVEKVIWKSDIEKAEKIISQIDIKSNQYRDDLIAVSNLLPYTVTFPELTKNNEKDYASKVKNKIGDFNDKLTTYDFEDFELGKKYIILRNKVQELIAAKGRLLQEDSYNKTLAAEALNRLAEYKKEFTSIQNTLSSLADEGEIQDLLQKYLDLKTRYLNDKQAQENVFTTLLTEYENTFIEKSQMISNQSNQKITDFYLNFKQAYESKNESQLMNLISDNWDSSDGTTLSDLETHFKRMFNIFDSLNFEISNIQYYKLSENIYNVSYEVLIKGINYEKDLNHEEKSTVNEQIIINKNGQIKLNKTLQGNYWYIK